MRAKRARRAKRDKNSKSRLIKWQYRFQPFDLNSGEDPLNRSEKEINEFGEEGWELVNLVPKMGCEGNWCIGAFKRQVRGD